MTASHPLPEYLQRLWFLHETAGTPGLLNIGVDLEIRGKHEPSEVQAALHAAVRRHDAFRLRFGLGTTSPTWCVADETAVAWEVEQVAAGAAVLESGELAREAAVRHSTGLDLASGPLVAGTLFVIEPRKSVLAITAHQLVADARGVRVLVEDFLEEWRFARGDPVRSRKPAASFAAWLASKEASALSLRPLGRGDRIHETRTHRTGGQGAEHVFRLGEGLVRRLQAQCGRCGVTSFTGLLAGFQLLCSEAGLLTPWGVGLVISDRDLRRFGRTAGCFVRMIPLRINIPPALSAMDLLKLTGDELTRVRRESAGVSDACGPTCRAMVSMVRDSGVRLVPPTGIQVEPHRRLRVQSECDLHLFLYDLGSDIEVVLNHDVSILTDTAIRTLGTRYLEFLGDFADSRCPRVARSQIQGRLHHVGLAAWEIELATLRLAAQGFQRPGPVALDEGAGVAMRIAGSIGGVALEVVAPLRQDAPCVGPLARDGEGAYHCCWEVKAARSVHELLERRGVRYTKLTEEMPTALFPGGRVSFALVPGIGVVEWLCMPQPSGAWTNDAVEARLRVEIESSDAVNGALFLEALGYDRCDEGAWRRPSANHEFALLRSERKTDRIVLVSETHAAPVADVSMATTWWSRVNMCVVGRSQI